MATDSLPRVRPGDPVRAEHYNALIDALEAAGLVPAAGSGIDRRGRTLVALRTWEADIKLTASGGSGRYAWTEQTRDDGTFADGARSGTATDDPANELNGNAAVPVPSTVRAWREPDGSLWFMADQC